ncbi:MAG: DUF2270 domain-containing protein [Verrucomicrobia bacterium]|nr:DUF2270 domain-containing protein [Verrucomicrobiota bacterium]
MSDANKPKGQIIADREYFSTMSHFYRGEIGRIMVWRQRLDTTTNWAILTATGIMTFALSHPEVSHVVFMVANVMVFLLLIIEGRRYRYYDAFRARVRMLEAHFLMPVVMRNAEMIEGDWRHLLAEDLLLPSFKIGMREAISRRLKRNYIWIFLILFLAWILKMFTHAGPILSLRQLLKAAQDNQPFSAVFFWGGQVVFYGMIIWLLFYAQKERYASGEMERRDPSRRRWRI